MYMYVHEKIIIYYYNDQKFSPILIDESYYTILNYQGSNLSFTCTSYLYVHG